MSFRRSSAAMTQLLAVAQLTTLFVLGWVGESAAGDSDPAVRNHVHFADESGAYGGYCSGASRKIVEGLAKQHADAGDGTQLIIANGGQALLFVIPVQQERDNLAMMFLMGEDPAWHKAVQAMYDSCIQLVYIVDPKAGVDKAAGFQLGELTYVTK